jgi:hypothetical protein
VVRAPHGQMRHGAPPRLDAPPPPMASSSPSSLCAAAATTPAHGARGGSRLPRLPRR